MRITKKITSIVLAVLMVVSMMSVMAVSASAAEETSTVTWNSFPGNGGMSSGGVTLTTTQGNTRMSNCFYSGRGTATFTAPEGSVFTKIEIKNCEDVSSLNFPGATVAQSGGYSKQDPWDDEPTWVPYYTVTWTGESSGVTFSGDFAGIQSIVFTLKSTATYVAQIGETKYETLADAFAAAKDGDKITVLADCAGNGIKVTPAGKFNDKGLTVDFDGHTYTVDGETVGSTGTETNGFQLLKNNNIKFKDGTITSAKAKILVQNYSNLELSNMTLTLNNPNYTQGYTLSDNNGIVTIDGTTINANPEGGFAFDVCRFSSYPSVTVIVTGGSVINGDVEISASKSDPKDGFTLSLQSGTLNGNIVIDPTAQTAMAADPDNSGIAKTSTFSQDAPEGYRWTDAGEGMQVLTAIPYVAQIGSTKYETLEEAFAAAQDGDTITVLADCAGNGIKVLKNTFATGLTVDFGGHTYTVDGETVGSPGTETLAFQLQYGNNITFKNGTLYSEKAKMLVQNYSNLTLDGMKLTFNNTSYNGAYTLSNNNGNTVIKDTTINANPTPGSFAFDVCRGGGSNLYPSVNVTVTGESVINGNVEVYAKNADPKEGFSLKLLSGTMTGNIVVDPTAKAVLDAKSDKGVVTKDNSFGQTAPEGLVWEDNGDGTSKLVPAEVNPLDALITKASDGNKFGITSQYYAGTILGVQKKEKITNAAVTSDKGAQEAAEGSDMRFVAVLDTETLQGADDYGFVLAKVGSNKDIASVGNEGLDKLKKGDDRFKTISAMNTYNTVCGTTAAAKKYGDPTETTTAYKYITCAVNGVDDSSKIVARFYVVKDGKTYYAKYAGHSYKYRGAVAGISDLV